MDSTREQDIKEFYKNNEYQINLHKEHLDEYIYNYWQYKPTQKLTECLDLLVDENDSLIVCGLEGLVLLTKGDSSTLLPPEENIIEFRYRDIDVEQFSEILNHFVIEYYDFQDEEFYIEVKDISEGRISFWVFVEENGKEVILKSRVMLGDVIIGATGNKNLLL